MFLARRGPSEEERPEQLSRKPSHNFSTTWGWQWWGAGVLSQAAPLARSHSKSAAESSEMSASTIVGSVDPLARVGRCSAAGAAVAAEAPPSAARCRAMAS